MARPLTAHGASHPGRDRSNNEDRLHFDLQRGIFLVVDGLGGHAAGERAADTAVRVLRTRLERETGTPAERLREGIAAANNEINRLAETDSSLGGMACVLTAAIVAGGRITIGHVGDTRLYRIRRGSIRKLTRDHSPVGEREDRGELSEADAMRHPRRHEVYRDVGSARHEGADTDFIEVAEQPFDDDSALIFCTDGLSDRLSSDAISRIVHEQAGDGAAVVERLVEAANAAGGQDNITVIYAEGPAFAASARRWLARGPGAPRQADGGPWWRALALSPAAWGLAGAALAVAVAFLAVISFDSVSGWLAGQARPGGWNRTWVVGSSGSADVATIGEAVALAGDGDTISVEPGIYRERVVLSRSLSLVGASGREAILAPATGSAGGWIAVTVRPGAKGRIAGFTVAGDEPGTLDIGLRISDAPVVVEDVEVRGATRAAIEVAGRASSLVRACYLHDNRGAGLSVGEEASPSLVHNVVTRNGTIGAPATGGIVLVSTARPVLFGNIVARNVGAEMAGLAPDLAADAARDNIIVSPPPPPAAPVRGPRRAPVSPIK